MIIEDYVSFETAKLLKEKGFNETTPASYNKNGESQEGFGRWNTTPIYYSAPTLQMAMKWLREAHGLFITIYPNYGTEKIAWSVHQRDYDMNWVTIKHNYADYYEEACEAAIKHCFENLI